MSFSAVDFARRHNLGPEMDRAERVRRLFDLLGDLEEEAAELLMREPAISPEAALQRVASQYLSRT